jgi:hypothetical protein
LILVLGLISASTYADTTCWRGGFVLAPKNQLAHLQLWNPGPDTIVVEWGYWTHAPADRDYGWVLGLSVDPLPTPAFENPKGINSNMRWGGDASTNGCNAELRTVSGDPQVIGQLINGTGIFQDDDLNFTLNPGTGLTVRGGSPGVGLRGGFRWKVLP